MARIAQQRIEGMTLVNVRQFIAPVEEAVLDSPVDALLFRCTHDVLRTPAALERLFGAARPGACVVVVGFKLPTDWRAIFNPSIGWGQLHQEDLSAEQAARDGLERAMTAFQTFGVVGFAEKRDQRVAPSV